MEKLRQFVMMCLRDCAKNPKELWINQAFGAVQFYIIENPDDYEEVAAMWSELKPHFERKIWGVSFEL